MAAPSTTLTAGLNSYYLIQLIESLSQLEIGYNPDVDDINQDLVLQFIKEGYQRIVALDSRLPWFQTSYQIQTLEDIRDYSTNFVLVTTWSPYITTPQANLTTASIREIINVVSVQGEDETGGYGLELIYLDNFKAQQIWNGTTDQSNIPAYWTLWNNSLRLYPKPNGVYTLNILGYRQPDYSWLTDSNNSESVQYVDIDNEFHMMLVNFTLARIFQFQEDSEMANVYMKHFDTGVSLAKANLTSPNNNQPIILSGGLQLTGTYLSGSFAGIQVLPGSPPLGRMY
jgi:hypothetical protein